MWFTIYNNIKKVGEQYSFMCSSKIKDLRPTNNKQMTFREYRACYQHSHNAIFHWNFQKYSVEIIDAICPGFLK